MNTAGRSIKQRMWTNNYKKGVFFSWYWLFKCTPVFSGFYFVILILLSDFALIWLITFSFKCTLCDVLVWLLQSVSSLYCIWNLYGEFITRRSVSCRAIWHRERQLSALRESGDPGVGYSRVLSPSLPVKTHQNDLHC